MKSWAQNEVELACKRENPDRKPGEFDYGCACYESALKAFNSLLEDSHSGTSIQLTKHILNRLIDGKPLTPIEDTEDVWEYVREVNGGKVKIYQCTRMSSLFKYESVDSGKVTYSDVDRITGYEIGSDVGFTSGLLTNIINSMFPITMPYSADKHYCVYVEEFLVDPKNGDFDTIGVLYVKDNTGTTYAINQYYKESSSTFVQISYGEYHERKANRVVKYNDQSNR